VKQSVAVVGGGPAGIAVARYLRSEGFAPAIFEQADRLGGHWSGDPRTSAVWPSMRTNTSRVMTAFSDLEHPAGTAVYPTNQEIGSYLERYAEESGLSPFVRTNVRVESVARDPEGGWVVRSAAPGARPLDERFAFVVVACGRYQKPAFPDVPGLESFAGSGGVSHTFAYKQPVRYRGQRVLVAGCATSALEIASDLAMLGAARVVTTNRRQRYIAVKLAGGVPTDHLVFTRFAALAAQTFPPEVNAAALKQLITRLSGSPEQYGAPKPADCILEAGISLSQYYLALVAEGRIEVRPWIERIDGGTVRFTDGREESFEAILFGTGYRLDLPFLSDDVRRTVGLTTGRLDLHALTFHPDLPNFACLGLFHQVGPYFPSIELQARWVAYTWSGRRPAPDRDEMLAGVAAARLRGPEPVSMHVTATRFAREAGVEPDLNAWPDLARALLFGPLTAISFRLNGPDSLPDAPRRVAEQARIFGAVPTPELTPQQCAELRALAEARNDPAFTAFVNDVTARAQGSAARA
jgi:cation diffusion facilitator CzcD-associated flavoprotein CzcO